MGVTLKTEKYIYNSSNLKEKNNDIKKSLTCMTEDCLKLASKVLFFRTNTIRNRPSHSEKFILGTGFLGSILTTDDSTYDELEKNN